MVVVVVAVRDVAVWLVRPLLRSLGQWRRPPAPTHVCNSLLSCASLTSTGIDSILLFDTPQQYTTSKYISYEYCETHHSRPLFSLQWFVVYHSGRNCISSVRIYPGTYQESEWGLWYITHQDHNGIHARGSVCIRCASGCSREWCIVPGCLLVGAGTRGGLVPVLLRPVLTS